MQQKLGLILAGLVLLAGCGGGGTSSTTNAQAEQKSWVRTHLADVYLWYNEIIDVPQPNYATASAYFDALLVPSRDRFSYSMPVAEAVSLLQSGLETGYGFQGGWAAPGRLFAYYVDPNSPAAVTLTRGAEITAINGQSIASLSSSYLNNTLNSRQAGTSVSLTFRAPGMSTTQTSTITSATFSTTTVGTPTILSLVGGGKAGYLLFNRHFLTAEQTLINAFTFFGQQGINELVLDMRYNSGGYLFIAEEVASMVGGSPVQGKVFERLLFNGKHPEKTNDPQNTFTFSTLDSKGGASLPQLGLSRVFVLTGSNTCSASEAIINSLLPYVQVVLIGKTTCGKPYGMVQTDHAGEAYFAIQFEGVNANGTDDYKSGFAPTCQVDDDLKYALGDTREARLSSALYYMSNNSCPPAATVTLPKSILPSQMPDSVAEPLMDQNPGLKLLR